MYVVRSCDFCRWSERDLPASNHVALLKIPIVFARSRTDRVLFRSEPRFPCLSSASLCSKWPRCWAAVTHSLTRAKSSTYGLNCRCHTLPYGCHAPILRRRHRLEAKVLIGDIQMSICLSDWPSESQTGKGVWSAMPKWDDLPSCTHYGTGDNRGRTAELSH